MEFNSNSRFVNVGKNATSALITKICILILTLISRKIFIQYIGVEYLGINALFSNILTLLAVADLGIGTAINVSLYKPIAENDVQKLSALLNYFRKIYYLIAFAVTIIGISLVPFLKYIINIDIDIPDLYACYIMFIVKNALSYLFIYKSSIISADQKNYIINRIDVLANVAKVLTQIIIIILFKNYLIYIIIDLIWIVIRNLILSHIVDKQYTFLKYNNQLSKTEKKKLFEDIKFAFLYKISGSILGGTDNILISIIAGTIAVGFYSNYYTITSTLESFVLLLFGSLTASIGNMVVTSSEKKRHETYRTMEMVGYWLAGIITVSLIFLVQDFMMLWLGKSFVLDNFVLFAIVINMFYTVCMRPVWTFREGTGMYRKIGRIMFLTAILNIVLSIIMGLRWGVGGILIATTISKFLTCFWYEPNILFRSFFRMSAKKYYLNFFFNIVILLFTSGLCFIPIYFIKGVSILSWLLKAFICFVIVNFLYLLRYYKTKEFQELKIKVYGLLKKVSV